MGERQDSYVIQRIAGELEKAIERGAVIEKQLAAAYAELHTITETLAQARAELGRLAEPP